MLRTLKTLRTLKVADERDRQVGDAMFCLVGMMCIILLAMLMSGCKAKERVVEVRHDSIAERVVHLTRVDTITAYLPSQSVSVVRMDSSHLATDYAESEAVIDSLGFLHHSLKNLPTPIKVLTLNTTDTVYRDVVKVCEKEVVKQEPMKWWQRLWWVWGIIGIGLCVSYKGIKILRRGLCVK